MCEVCNDDEKLKLEDPIRYYLKHSDDEEIMTQLKWEDYEFYQLVIRLIFLDQAINHEPIWRCPECGAYVTIDKDKSEEYCPSCGLITRNCYPYTAGNKYELPYGLRL